MAKDTIIIHSSQRAAIQRAQSVSVNMSDTDLADRLEGDAQTIELTGMAYAPTMMREAAKRLRTKSVR